MELKKKKKRGMFVVTNEKKPLKEKEQMQVTHIFSLTHNVFKMILPQGHQILVKLFLGNYKQISNISVNHK